jgi:hypothetical protein
MKLFQKLSPKQCRELRAKGAVGVTLACLIVFIVMALGATMCDSRARARNFRHFTHQTVLTKDTDIGTVPFRRGNIQRYWVTLSNGVRYRCEINSFDSGPWGGNALYDSMWQGDVVDVDVTEDMTDTPILLRVSVSRP